MNLNLAGKQALVGGGSDGIGFAAAEELARMGASVTLLARNREKLSRQVTKLARPNGQEHQILVADFNDPIAVESSLRAVLEAGQSFQILINNTGGPPPGPAHLAEVEAYLSAFRQHLIINQILVKLLLPGMEKADYGRIVNVISTSVKAPLPNLGVSNTVRGAVANWAKSLSLELGPKGITVNNVLPGATRTGRLQSIIANKAQKSGISEAEATASMTAAVPLRRFAQAEEVANAIAFLASPAAAYISGINLPVDGGRTPNL